MMGRSCSCGIARFDVPSLAGRQAPFLTSRASSYTTFTYLFPSAIRSGTGCLTSTRAHGFMGAPAIFFPEQSAFGHIGSEIFPCVRFPDYLCPGLKRGRGSTQLALTDPQPKTPGLCFNRSLILSSGHPRVCRFPLPHRTGECSGRDFGPNYSNAPHECKFCCMAQRPVGGPRAVFFRRFSPVRHQRWDSAP